MNPVATAADSTRIARRSHGGRWYTIGARRSRSIVPKGVLAFARWCDRHQVRQHRKGAKESNAASERLSAPKPFMAMPLEHAIFKITGIRVRVGSGPIGERPSPGSVPLGAGFGQWLQWTIFKTAKTLRRLPVADVFKGGGPRLQRRHRKSSVDQLGQCAAFRGESQVIVDRPSRL